MSEPCTHGVCLDSDGCRFDEHGNLSDTCGMCTLVPSVCGWARLADSDCPRHGIFATPAPDVQLVTEAIRARTTPGYWDATRNADTLAEIAVSALSAAGRLRAPFVAVHTCDGRTYRPQDVSFVTVATARGNTWAAQVTATGFDTGEDTDEP